MPDFHVQEVDGSLILEGEGYNNLLSSIDTTEFTGSSSEIASHHITILNNSEFQTIAPEYIKELLKIHIRGDRIYPFGIGNDSKHPEYHYILVVWTEGQKIRQRFGLQPRHFHIPLNYTSDRPDDFVPDLKDIIQETIPLNPSIEMLDDLIYTLHLVRDFKAALDYCVKLVLLSTQSGEAISKAYTRLGDTAFQNGSFKLAMLSYARAVANLNEEEDRISKYCMKRLEKCSHHTEWGWVFQEHEMDQIPKGISTMLLQPSSAELKISVGDLELNPTLCIDSRHRMYIPLTSSTTSDTTPQGYYKLPRFFRWIVPFSLAVMSTPRNEEDIIALSSMGIQTILTLTEETPLPAEWFKHQPIKNIFIPVPNYHPPSLEQMDIIIQLLNDENNLPMLVHCGGGKGRAGTVIACYLATYGYKRPSGDRMHPTMSASEAISSLRKIRPGSLETSQQEELVSKWCSTIWKRQSIFPDRPSEPVPCKLEFEGSLEKDSNLFILVGLPGSGKSWFSQALLARDPMTWKRISQDECGSRHTCENEISYTPPTAKTKVLLDRCNMSKEDRKKWLDLSLNWVKNPICIWFNYQKSLCESRAQRRIGHPTLQPGNRVRNAIKQMDRIFDPPTLNEGFKGIFTVRSFEAALQLVRLLSPPIGIYKFPRTPHLIDLGAATEDDLVDSRQIAFNEDQRSISDGRSGEKVIITEKIDGANMGFSLSSDKTRIIVQNRSHYVNPSSHEQFKKLGHWLEVHQDGLMNLLNQDESFPERYILFGEWMYAKHSIHYTDLPNRFIAFDLYDRSTNSFLDRSRLESLLQRYTSIPLVPPILETDHCPSEEGLREMVQQKSNFYDGKVEGIYVKWESGGRVVKRGKVVRSDFIAGNEHWCKRKMEVNGLAISET